MLRSRIRLKYNLSWVEQGAHLFIWSLLVAAISLALLNLLVYFFVPIDGASIWVRQGPIRVLTTAYSPTETDIPPANSLLAGDVILKVSNTDVEGWLAQKWQSWPTIFSRRASNNPTLEMTIQRNQGEQTLQVPLSIRLQGRTGSQILTGMTLSFAYMIVSLIILKVRGGEFTARLAALVLALLALLEQNDLLTLLGVEWAFSTLWLFIPLRLLTRWVAYAGTLHFCLIFPTPKTWLKRVPWLMPLIYLLNPVVTLSIMFFAEGNLHARHGAAYAWTKNIYIAYLILAALALGHAYLTSKGPLAKTQMKWIAWGVSIAIIPNILLVDLPILIFSRRLIPVEISGLLMLMVPFVTMIALVQYRLWDVTLVIRASLIYGTLTMFLGAVYVILISTFVGIIGLSGQSSNPSGNPTIYFIAAIILVALFNPTRQYFQRFIDRIFYRDKPNHTQILNELSHAFVTSIVYGDIITLLLETLPRKLKAEGAEVILEALPDQNSEVYTTLKQGNVVWLYTLKGEPFPFGPPLSDLQAFGMYLCAPLISGGTVLGLYGLGPKKSGEFYSADDISLIETLSRQAGIALENASLSAQITDQVRLERDLEIAEQIQLSLLPDGDPDLPGLDIAGFSMPAQSVGGDFYHYVEFDDNQLGIAVGDVSGKGVSAALLMAVSVSNLRAYAPRYNQQTYPLLVEMNSLLQHQTRLSHVNVAMLYATIQTEPDDSLRFNVSNGGLVSPILRREGQESEFLDACGLPLGIIANPSYYECSFRLVSGDLIVLCSDGIVEAMNPANEMFGFDQLLSTIDEIPFHLSAANVVAYLRQTVSQFVKHAPPLDDITIVAIRVR